MKRIHGLRSLSLIGFLAGVQYSYAQPGDAAPTSNEASSALVDKKAMRKADRKLSADVRSIEQKQRHRCD